MSRWAMGFRLWARVGKPSYPKLPDHSDLSFISQEKPGRYLGCREAGWGSRTWEWVRGGGRPETFGLQERVRPPLECPAHFEHL